MSSEHRAVLLQNDDPSITYIGEWTAVEASVVGEFGNFGPAFSPTLKSTKTMSSFFFPFNGSSINAFGTINIKNFSTNPNPNWQCSLDGFVFSPNLFDFAENNWPLCNLGNFPDGSHELIVNVTSDGVPFYLDYLEYQAPANVSLENNLIMIDNTDSAIDYISGWDALGSTANQTTNPSGLVNVTFVGTQLSWYGFIPTEESHTPSSGEYSIDGQPFVPFNLSGLPLTTTATAFNQRFFITPTLKMSSHVLSVKYTGSQGQTPLTLDYLIVLNGSFPSSSSHETVAPTPTPTQAPFSSTSSTFSGAAKKSSSNVGAIVGGVIGAIVAVALAIIIFFLVKSRRSGSRRRLQEHEDSSNGFMPSSSYNTQSHLPTVLPPLPPLETMEFSKNHIRYSLAQLTDYSTNMTSLPSESYGSYSTTTNNDNANTTSFYATNRVSSIASIASSIIHTAVRRPLPSAPAVVVRKKSTGTAAITGDFVQHKDSGIRLPGMPFFNREKEITPRYVIFNNTSQSFTS